MTSFFYNPGTVLMHSIDSVEFQDEMASRAQDNNVNEILSLLPIISQF